MTRAYGQGLGTSKKQSFQTKHPSSGQIENKLKTYMRNFLQSEKKLENPEKNPWITGKS